MVGLATREAPAEPDTGKNPAAAALGRLGGLKGGKARAKKLGKAKLKAAAMAGPYHGQLALNNEMIVICMFST